MKRNCLWAWNIGETSWSLLFGIEKWKKNIPKWFTVGEKNNTRTIKLYFIPFFFSVSHTKFVSCQIWFCTTINYSKHLFLVYNLCCVLHWTVANLKWTIFVQLTEVQLAALNLIHQVWQTTPARQFWYNV